MIDFQSFIFEFQTKNIEWFEKYISSLFVRDFVFFLILMYCFELTRWFLHKLNLITQTICYDIGRLHQEYLCSMTVVLVS